ncbi:SpoIIE family protein phosphatase [Herbidospora sp. NEAU-GS84]|uniref:SpoIIE family protein phosphatase n=1 Tax=Herbidospora solisilvae TaxID=2696284 RepID=A0A7C9MYP6_9ACTN|nr:fused response regulator/phosphatase [Herbidospora solisilvae]NAS21290.1 SpoIIE family protein phosphatase [Herbidospora solisilvae]
MPERILVVDDISANRYVIATWLQHSGYAVVEASSGGEALRLVKESLPDLVLLDVRMPDMSGFEVCERIKADPYSAAVPVIHLTASAVGVTDRTQGLARGADAYLVEPVEPEVLLATVNATLRYARARRQAERLAGRLAGLSDATLAINMAGTLDDLLRAAADGASRMFGGPATVFAPTEEGSRYVTCDHDGMVAGDSPLLDPGGVPRGPTMRTTPGSDWAGVLAPSVAAEEVKVALARVQGRPPVGVLVEAALAFGDDDAHVLSQLSMGVALAVEALRLIDEERRIALTLQRALLPRSLPEVEGVELAARYVPASAKAEIGGDFYEVIEIGGKLMVAIGDVMGHSLHAATVMAEIRHAVRAYASEGHPLDEILRQVNLLMLRFLPRELATVALLLLTPSTGEIVMCNAGHLPPLLVSDRRADYLSMPGPLLGARLHRPGEARFTLEPGQALVLVTDGLVERRDLTLQDGMARLQELSGTVEDDLEAYCDRVIDAMMRPDHEDDVALVVLRRAA